MRIAIAKRLKHGVGAKTAITDEVMSRLTTRLRSCIPFRHMRFTQDQYVSPSRRTVLLCYSNDPSDAERPLIIDQPGMPALCYAVCGDLDAPAESDRALSFAPQTTLHARLSRCGGAFAVVAVDGENDTIGATNSLAAIEPVFWADTPKMTVLGTWALLVHLAVFELDEPRFDPQALYSLISAGFFLDGRTAFEGVRILPPASSVVAGSDGLRICSADITELFGHPEPPTDDLCDEAADAFVRTFEPLKRADQPVSLGLTGGRDSRLILAGLLANGIPVTTYTFARGAANRADVEAATALAEAAQVPHEIRSPTPAGGDDPIVIDLLNRTSAVLAATDCGLTIHENLSRPVRFDPSFAVNGAGGELIRGGYAKTVQNYDPGNVCLADFIHQKLLPFDEFFEPEALRTHADETASWMNAFTRLPSDAALDAFYLVYRCGRWSTAGSRIARMSKRLVYPFFDNRFLRIAYKFSTQDRVDQDLHFHLLLRTAPKLIDIPYESEWRSRQPSEPASPTQARGFDWRERSQNELRDEFERQVFSEQSAELLRNVVLMPRVHRWVETPTSRERRFRPLWMGLYSASVLLGGGWLAARLPTRRVELKRLRAL